MLWASSRSCLDSKRIVDKKAETNIFWQNKIPVLLHDQLFRRPAPAESVVLNLNLCQTDSEKVK